MAWSQDEFHVISDRWRVSSLFRAFVDLILALCVLLCLVISITIEKLVKASRYFPSCLICESNHLGSTHGDDARRCQKLEFVERQMDRLPSNRGYGVHRNPAGMSFICENCTLALHHCLCPLGSSSGSDYHRSLRNGRNVFSPNSPLDSHKYWPSGDTTSQQSGNYFPENVDSSCNWSDSLEIDSPTVSCGCRCRSCYNPGPGLSPNSGRAPKRKFFKVSPSESRDSSTDPARGLAHRDCAIPRKETAEITNPTFKQQGDCSPISFQESNNAITEEEQLQKHVLSPSAYRARNFQEESSRRSSQESFSYNRRSGLPFLKIGENSANRTGEVLSIDSDLLCGETTPESNGSFASPPHEADEEDSIVQFDDPDMGVVELREALQAEQEALATLYIELEEERNASSSAANEAMAMISRLQEEKAAVQMEARQYQRMAEEKQMYDQEAIAMLQEILLRRDEELYALEEELNSCRRRLLTLGMDDLMEENDRATVRSPRVANDVLLVERETPKLEGNEDWRKRKASQDDELVADIKEWLHVAHVKVGSDKIEDLDSHVSSQRLPSETKSLSISNGRKNLLESFTSVAEKSPRDGVERGGAGSPEDTAAGYESFQGMMESLRKEPRLRDDESLQTLKKIEEKFQKQSRKGTARNGEEMRQIWKNILRSFEIDGGDNTESKNELNSRAHSPSITLEYADSGGDLHHDVVGDADANRAIEEKRLSVLEYVWKFEEQLHQLGKKPVPLGKSGSSTVESVPDDTLESKESTELHVKESDSDGTKKASSGGGRLNTMKSRLRKLATDADSASLTRDEDRVTVRSPSVGKATSTQEARIQSQPSYNEEKNLEESFLVHDVYEVQKDVPESLLEVTLQSKREEHLSTECIKTSLPSTVERLVRGESIDFQEGCGKDFVTDIKKSVSSTVNELVRGEFMDSHVTAHCVEFVITEDADRLGKPDLISEHTSQEVRVDSNYTACAATIGGFTTSNAEDGIREHGDLRLGDSGLDLDILQATNGTHPQQSLVQVVAPTMSMEDVQHLTFRLNSLETDRQQHTISSLRRENGEMKVLQEITQQLRELRGMDHTAMTTNSWQSEDPTSVSSIKRAEAVR